MTLAPGCGGGDPNQAMAHRLVANGFVDLNEVCGVAEVHGTQRAEEGVLRDIQIAGGPDTYTDGATPQAVGRDLLAPCHSDGTWSDAP